MEKSERRACGAQAQGLSHSKALTGNLLTQHRLPRPPSSPFPHAGSSTISSSFMPAHSIASPRRLRLQLRAPRTRRAVGGISGRSGREAPAEPAAKGRCGVLSVPSLLVARRSLHRQRSGQPGTVPFSSPNSPPSLHKGRIIREEHPHPPPPSVSSTYSCAQIWQGSHPSPD